MNEIMLATGIVLRSIPVSPNDDYMAGSDGQIYSRTRYKGFGRKDYVAWYPLRPHRNGKGYLTVSLCHENRKVTRSVHRLVCMAFHGMPPIATMQTRHLDGKPENNLPDNLAWGTQKENWQDRRIHGTASVGEKHWNAHFTDEERAHIQWAVVRGLCSQHQAARTLGVTQSCISAIVHTK